MPLLEPFIDLVLGLALRALIWLVVTTAKLAARFVWSAITPESARWEQCFSYDHGATWESNWVMELRRVQ